MSDTTGPPSLLLDIGQLATVLNRSPASLRRDDDAGRLPSAVRIGGSKRWRREEIAAWVAAGCPNRKTWTLTTNTNGAAK